MKYTRKKKPVEEDTCEAVQWTGANFSEIFSFLGLSAEEGDLVKDQFKEQRDSLKLALHLYSLQLGSFNVSLNNWIIKGEGVLLSDIATGKDLTINDERLGALSKGDMFGARVLDLGEGPILTNAIYPFGNRFKEHVMKNLDSMYNRHEKHCEGQSCMEDFLRQETYTINTVWVTCLFKAK